MSKVAEIFQTLEYGPAPEAAGPALEWLDRHGRTFGHFIGGGFTKPGKTFASVNPANGEKLADVTDGTAADVAKAVKAARAAFAGWSGLSGFERAKYLYAIARQIQKESRLFAVLETLDSGKPIRETRDIDIPLVARHFYHHAGWAQHIGTEFPGHVPYGVCGQIIPWNFPLLMLAWKIAPALAAGNTVVLKPAEFTSLTALLFAEICQRIGLPEGVVNIVTGAGETGEAITAHPDIDKIAFTGSTEVGKIIRRATAGSGKGLSLELGGKSPFVVFEDADLDSAVEGLVDAIWFNQGQVCCAGSRLLVQESIEERFIAKIKARMQTLRTGDPLDKSIDIGALVAPVQVERVLDLLKAGRLEGGDFYSPDTEIPGDGCYLRPTLVTGISPAHSLASEEIFGPVLVAMSFRTPEEAVALANNTRYGLAASVWTENVNLALDIAPQIKAGVVWINSTNQFDAAVGFGGYRESGFGREGGKEGMGAYLKPGWEKKLSAAKPPKLPAAAGRGEAAGIDRTAKLYIGGKQARPDSGYAMGVVGADGRHLGEVGEGNRKDIRNAVEAARNGLNWARTTAHNRAQILYYLGENLDYRRAEFADRIQAMTGSSAEAAAREVDLSVERLFGFAGWADKFDGAVHNPPVRMMAVAMVEPLGVLGIAAPAESPLLGAIALLAPAIAMGNTVVLIPSSPHPLAMTDFYQVLETSDMPAGVVNIVTGPAPDLAKVLAEHDGVDGIWFAGSFGDCADIERLSAGNVKQSWTTRGLAYDWSAPELAGDYLLKKATQIKNVWVPYGA
ncbi:aldehyde dehydrogenase family protein [Pelagibacterium lacus]|uniref:Aldehyde dehydrogenase family protein n=1 Tax=Pelagibacterium lacus TaxID=2282655 RepID=A0A369W6P5_9HYPH|nr:aldehyde dehydrogenase family protein [Pelagibacterium lacus]RDE10003.1 aldehyde dehydrogenase family protein [Pelagibacterium lacus]